MKNNNFLVSANGRIVLCETLVEAKAKVRTLEEFGVKAKIYYPYPVISVSLLLGEA